MDATGVLICGAGPTGLSLALELARFNVPFRIIDRRPEPVRGSQALALFPRTLELLEASHLTEKLLVFAEKLATIVIRSAVRPPVELQFQSLETAYPYVAIVPQDAIERAMIVRLNELGHTVERERELVRLSNEDDAVYAGIAGDGTLRAAYVAGCDGAQSTVRELLRLHDSGRARAEHIALADVRLRTELPRSRAELRLQADGTTLAVVPMPDGFWRLMLGAAAPFARDPDPATLDAALARFGVAATVDAIDWRARWTAERRNVDAYRSGRAFVLGNAAHVHSALAGGDLNTGIGDAINLGWKLALVLNRGVPETLLDTYHDERAAIGRAQLDVADAERLPRDTERLAETIAELRIAYPRSRLSRDDGAAGRSLRAGMRVRGHRPAGDVPQAVVAPSLDGSPEFTLVVRPDGYAGYVADGIRTAEAAQYLADVLGLAAGTDASGG